MSLIATIAEFQKYITIDGNTRIATLAPYITEAEEFFIIDLLGRAFYEEFHALYTDSVATVSPVPLSEENKKLLVYIQRCLAYYAQLQAIPHLTSTFGELGIRQHRAEDSDAAPRWLQEKLQFTALRNGDLHADKLLEFLETNASVLVYNTWFASTNNTKLSGFIVYSTAVASRHIDINFSRRIFLKLKTKIRDLETRVIPKLISAPQYSELVTQLTTGGPGIPTASNTKLIAKLEPIIAKRALYLALPFLRVSIGDNGLLMYSGTDELITRDQLASDSEIKILRAQLMDGELGYLSDEEELSQFLLDNVADYPLVAATTVHTGRPEPGPTWRTADPGPDDKFLAL
ncbi:MAG TPA: DUF6712 family protein [Chryseolinea sp.]|nr:DUF6712 family protein [Chryseolinea sp.]